MKRETGVISVVGSMFGGKSTITVKLASIEKNLGKKVQAFKSIIDDRYLTDCISTHDGATFPATPVRSVSEMVSLIDNDTDVIVVDEDQFWDEELYDFVDKFKDKLMIINNTLQFNYMGQIFRLRRKGTMEPSEKHSGMDIAKLGKMIIAYPQCFFGGDRYACRNEAIYTQKFTKEGNLAPHSEIEIVTGSEDIYSARCSNHFARPLPNGNFLYQGEEYSNKELKEKYPEIFLNGKTAKEKA